MRLLVVSMVLEAEQHTAHAVPVNANQVNPADVLPVLVFASCVALLSPDRGYGASRAKTIP